MRQEIMLGIGGVKALAALGIQPAVFHMNEGHSAFWRWNAFVSMSEKKLGFLFSPSVGSGRQCFYHAYSGSRRQ